MAELEVVVLCPAGFEAVVARAARQELLDYVESAQSSGFIRALTSATVRQLRAFVCATNVFNVIGSVPRSRVEREVRRLAGLLPAIPRPTGLPKRGTLRLRLHDDGRFSSTSTDAIRALEGAVASWAGLAVSRRSASIEVWIIRRAEQPETVLTTKLTQGARESEPGVLRPEICAALARVEPLSGRAIVLDPFAGSGALGRACAQAGARRVWLNDVQAHTSRPRSRNQGPTNVEWTDADFRALDVTPGSISAIVTDPPWGHFAAIPGGIDTLYADFGSAAVRWLEPGGALVMLTAAPPTTIERLLDAGGLQPELNVPVLVNGRKARVVRARKPRHTSNQARS